MGPHLAVIHDVPEPAQCGAHPLHGAEAEDVGGQPIEGEVLGQPTERGGGGGV